jgi:hypothetical protein
MNEKQHTEIVNALRSIHIALWAIFGWLLFHWRP